MTSTLASRKALEIVAKVDSVSAEFEFWHEQSETGKPLQKHFSQIRAATTQLGDLAATISANVSAGPAVTRGWPTQERDVLELHRVWNYFRSKFAQRFVPPFRVPLAAADDLAWACYQPVQTQAVEHGTVDGQLVKEPPLVFLNGGSSPMTTGRDKAFQAEDVPGEGMLTTPQLVEILKRLPIPVIGVPWYQVHFLPDMLIVAHEVGHNVEEDFDLDLTLRKNVLRVVGATRKDAWRVWLGEVFADVFGVVATGPAFVEALVDFLAKDNDQITTEVRAAGSYGRYPTDFLRVLIAVEVLKQRIFTVKGAKQRSFSAVGDELEDRWRQSFVTHAMPAFEADIPKVVEAILYGPYPELGNVGLTDIPDFGFRPSQQTAAMNGVDLLDDNAELTSYDMREILATARLAFTNDPTAYATRDDHGRNYHDRVLSRIEAVQRDGVRSGRADEVARQERDEGVGAGLLAAIDQLRRS